VEGFEFSALKGMSGFLEDCLKKGSGPVIVCEVFPGLYSVLEYNVKDIFEYMKSFSYIPFEILNPKKRITSGERGLGDILFKFQKI